MMASLYQPTVIRYVVFKGRVNGQDKFEQVPKGTPGAKRVREKSNTWWGRYRDAQKKPKRVSLSDVRDAAETMLNEITKRARREEAGDIDPFQDHRKKSL